MRRINHIVIHNSATPEGRDVDAAEIRRWHMQERGWSDIGYHFVIKIDGTVEPGRPLSRSGAHVKGHNKHSIGICYVGGKSSAGRALDTRTPRQKQSLKKLLISLKSKFPEAEICGHRDFSPDKNGNGVIEPSEWLKVCPCFDAKKEYGYL